MGFRPVESTDKCGWKPTESSVLENVRYGSVRHRMAVKDDDSYDFPQIWDSGGVACLPILENGTVALVSIFRPVLIDSPAGSYPNYESSDFGAWLLEVPRGYADGRPDAHAKELEEETGLIVLSSVAVGKAFYNTAALPCPVELFISRVTGTATPQTAESIRQVVLVSDIRGMVARGEIQCSITMSLLAHAFARGIL